MVRRFGWWCWIQVSLPGDQKQRWCRHSLGPLVYSSATGTEQAVGSLPRPGDRDPIEYTYCRQVCESANKLAKSWRKCYRSKRRRWWYMAVRVWSECEYHSIVKYRIMTWNLPIPIRNRFDHDVLIFVDKTACFDDKFAGTFPKIYQRNHLAGIISPICLKYSSWPIKINFAGTQRCRLWHRISGYWPRFALIEIMRVHQEDFAQCDRQRQPRRYLLNFSLEYRCVLKWRISLFAILLIPNFIMGILVQATRWLKSKDA